MTHKVSITSAPVEIINFKSKADGSAQSMRKQTAYLHTILPDGTPSPFPDKFSFIVERDSAPYAAGEYTLHPSALRVDRDGRLSCVPLLTPVVKRAS